MCRDMCNLHASVCAKVKWWAVYICQPGGQYIYLNLVGSMYINLVGSIYVNLVGSIHTSSQDFMRYQTGLDPLFQIGSSSL